MRIQRQDPYPKNRWETGMHLRDMLRARMIQNQWSRLLMAMEKTDPTTAGEVAKVHCWRRHQGTKLEQFAKLLERLAEHEAKGSVEVHFEARCRKCNRELTTPESVQSGIGPICAGRD